MRSAFVAVLALAATVGAQPALVKKGPHLPPLPAAPVVPSPMPGPDAATVLEKGVEFLIDHDSECVVESFPPSLMEIVERQVPAGMTWTLTGRFVDEKDSSKVFEGDREFKGPCYIYRVRPKEAGTGWLYILPVGGKKNDAIRRKVQCNLGPKPPPDVDPKPPEPKPVDPPIPASGLHVLVVYESGAPLTQAQVSAIYGKEVRDYLNAKCVLGPDGKTRQFRIWDQNTDGYGDSKLWGDAMKKVQGKPMPYCVISDGKTGFEGALPADFLSLLKKYGG